MNKQLSDKMIKLLTELADTKLATDDEDYDPFEYSDGNFDDTWARGCTEGEVTLARTIIKDLKGE